MGSTCQHDSTYEDQETMYPGLTQDTNMFPELFLGWSYNKTNPLSENGLRVRDYVRIIIEGCG